MTSLVSNAQFNRNGCRTRKESSSAARVAIGCKSGIKNADAVYQQTHSKSNKLTQGATLGPSLHRKPYFFPSNPLRRHVLRKRRMKDRADELLQVENLTVGYRTETGRIEHALREVSFRLRRHQCAVILGESGSGKTTL